MSDTGQGPAQTARAISVRVAKKTAVLAGLAALGVLAVGLFQGPGQRPWFPPVSILFGGGLGLMNFRWLATAVEQLYLSKRATALTSNIAALVISVLKLFAIFIVLFIVIKWSLFHIFGMVTGLSLCFLAILWEGVTVMKQNLKSSE